MRESWLNLGDWGVDTEPVRAKIPYNLATMSILNKIGLITAIMFLLLGGLLLYGPVSGSDTTQTARVLAGASLVSLGFMTILLITRDWLNWKRLYKNEGRGRDHG
jgi:hypothetical protein